MRISRRVLPVSIHAPHEGERQINAAQNHIKRGFQSTLPTRGSDTPQISPQLIAQAFQSTLPTRGSDCRGRTSLVYN